MATGFLFFLYIFGLSNWATSQASIDATSPVVSSTVLAACKHILILSAPKGTVGATIGRTMNPSR